MTRTLPVACFLALWIAAVPGAQAPRAPRIAVLDFDYATVHDNIAAIFGTNVDVGRGITDLLVTHLVQDGSYSVIERRALDQILAEQNFSNSDRADATSAAQIGRLLGVDAVVVGSITQFGNDTQTTGVGGVGSRLGRFGLGGVNREASKAIVGVTARIVSVETAEILAVAEGKGESQRTSTSLAGAGGGWTGFGGGAVNFGSSDFQNTIIGEAVAAAVDDMTSSVVAGRERVAVRQRVIEGLVAAVVDTQVILNVGSTAGLQVGDRLTVQRVSQEIKDPVTGDVIRRLTTDVGVVRVVDVDAGSAVAEVESGSGFQTSDLVRTVAP